MKRIVIALFTIAMAACGSQSTPEPSQPSAMASAPSAPAPQPAAAVTDTPPPAEPDFDFKQWEKQVSDEDRQRVEAAYVALCECTDRGDCPVRETDFMDSLASVKPALPDTVLAEFQSSLKYIPDSCELMEFSGLFGPSGGDAASPQSCPAGQVWDECAGGSCPTCDDCVAGCVPE